jgi:Helitron helicase-like domain at N-terminus
VADLFITMTANPKWPEVLDALLPGQTPSDRPNLVSRVFHQKKAPSH